VHQKQKGRATGKSLKRPRMGVWGFWPPGFLSPVVRIDPGGALNPGLNTLPLRHQKWLKPFWAK
jgi:hypothetical protein